MVGSRHRWFSSRRTHLPSPAVPLSTPTQEKATPQKNTSPTSAASSNNSDLNITASTFSLKVSSLAPDPNGGFSPPTLPCPHPQRPHRNPPCRQSDPHHRRHRHTQPPSNIPDSEDLPLAVSHYFPRSRTPISAKNLLIVGGKNSAVEAALRCHRAGAKVHFSYLLRGPKSRCRAAFQIPGSTRNSHRLMKSGEITPHMNTVPTKRSLPPTSRPRLGHRCEYQSLITNCLSTLSTSSPAYPCRHVPRAARPVSPSLPKTSAPTFNPNTHGNQHPQPLHRRHRHHRRHPAQATKSSSKSCHIHVHPHPRPPHRPIASTNHSVHPHLTTALKAEKQIALLRCSQLFTLFACIRMIMELASNRRGHRHN